MLGNVIEDIDVEGLADVIAGKVLDGSVDDELVAARLPRRAWSETPPGLLPLDVHRALHRASASRYTKHSLQQRVVHGLGEVHDQRFRGAGLWRSRAPRLGIRWLAILGSAADGTGETLDHRHAARIRPFAIDHQPIALAFRDGCAHGFIRCQPALDAAGV